MSISFHGGVPQSTHLLQGGEVFGVAVIVGTDEHDGVEVSRSTGFEGELSVEADRSGRDGSLGRADDHDDDTLGGERGLDLGNNGSAESGQQEQTDLSSGGGEGLTLAGNLRQVFRLSAVVRSDHIWDCQSSKVGSDLDGKIVVDDVEALDHALLDNLFVTLAKFESGGALAREKDRGIQRQFEGRSAVLYSR